MDSSYVVTVSLWSLAPAAMSEYAGVISKDFRQVRSVQQVRSCVFRRPVLHDKTEKFSGGREIAGNCDQRLVTHECD